jgi:tetraacyldisaccharide 4'-kinase
VNSFESIISGQSKGALAGAARASLGALSLLYAAAMRTRNFFYDRNLLNVARLPRPTISVGNLTVGGTGKTPLVEYVARRFIRSGRRVVVLSRGYGARAEIGESNDEAAVLAANVPEAVQVQSKNRHSAGLRAMSKHAPDVFILDDGFQHRRLARDLDVLVVDCACPFGYGKLLPRGFLREPTRSASRADCIVLSKSDEVAPEEVDRIARALSTIAPRAKIFRAVYLPASLEPFDKSGPQISLDEARGRKVLAFCGIGAPRSFRASLEKIGCEVAKFLEFPDHHRYNRADAEKIQKEFASSGAEFVVTTQKDAVKARAFGLPRAYWLKIETAFPADAGAFDGFIDGVFKNTKD